MGLGLSLALSFPAKMIDNDDFALHPQPDRHGFINPVLIQPGLARPHWNRVANAR
jgi:hypothetical protein